MADLKPIASAPASDAKATLTSVASGKPIVKRKITVFAGDDDAATPHTILLYGPSGSGKSQSIAGLLSAGLKVFVIVTDMAGIAGLNSVKEALAADRTALKRLRAVELLSYDEVEAFVKAPESISPDIYEWAPDVLAWDGFSTFQDVHLDEYVLEQDERSAKDESGLWADKQDWGKIKRGTVRNLARFMSLTNKLTGAPFHKYVTMHEDNKAADFGGVNKGQRGPAISGAAKRNIEPAFSLIINARVIDENGKPTYKYFLRTNDNALTKTRGYSQLAAIEPADMCALWHKMNNNNKGADNN